jgi:uncharacterized Zn-binding protein involved in type VI secretion
MSKAAARVGDPTLHGGKLAGPGCVNVMIGGKPAARAGDSHVCPLSNGPQPHVGGLISAGSKSVFIGGLPAARMDDACLCVGSATKIAAGDLTVLIGG